MNDGFFLSSLKCHGNQSSVTHGRAPEQGAEIDACSCWSTISLVALCCSAVGCIWVLAPQVECCIMTKVPRRCLENIKWWWMRGLWTGSKFILTSTGCIFSPGLGSLQHDFLGCQSDAVACFLCKQMTLGHYITAIGHHLVTFENSNSVKKNSNFQRWS